MKYHDDEVLKFEKHLPNTLIDEENQKEFCWQKTRSKEKSLRIMLSKQEKKTYIKFFINLNSSYKTLFESFIKTSTSLPSQCNEMMSHLEFTERVYFF